MNGYGCKRYICLLLQLALWLTATGQGRAGNFRIYGREEGLPPSLYHKVYQSQDGFFWIASQNGLLRFDGLRFEVFYSSITDSNSLSDNVVLDIEEDNENNLWIATLHEGVSKLDLKTYKWTRYNRFTSDRSSYFGVYDIYKDNRGELWFGSTGRGFFRYDKSKDRFEQFIPDAHRPVGGSIRFANDVRKIQEDPADHTILWLAGMEGLYRFDKSGKKIQKWQNIKNGSADWKDNCFHSLFVQDSVIWLATWGGGLVGFNRKTAKFTNYPYDQKQYAANNLSKNIIADIYPDSDSTLLLTTGEMGLLQFHIHTKSYSILINEDLYPWLRNYNGLTNISRSGNGAIWIAGMNYISQKNELFDRFGLPVYFPSSPGLDERPGLQGGIYNEYNHTYWLTTGNGSLVYEYDSSFNYIKSIPFPFRDISDIIIRAIHQTAEGYILVSPDASPFLCIYDKQEKKFIPVNRFFPHKEWDAGRIFFHMAEGKDNSTWLAARGELLKWDRKNKTIRSFAYGDETSLPVNEKPLPRKMIADHKGNIWIATYNGIYIFNTTEESWTHLKAGDKGQGGLGNNRVTDLLEDSMHNIWIAIESQGIQVYNPGSKTFTRWFHPDNGFLSTRAVYLTNDINGDVWAATLNGLGRYISQTGTWQWFDRNDGLTKDYLDQPIISMKNGVIVLGVADGFHFFRPASLKTNGVVPHVYITQVLVNNKSLPFDLKDKKLRFSPDENFIEINYTAIDPVFARRLTFQYQLSGSNVEWITTTSRKVVFAGLAPGNYEFRVRAINSDGIESREETVFSFVIRPPFWKTAWFISLLAAAAISFFYLLYRYRVRQLYKMHEIRNTISRDLHDELGSSVSSVNMLATVAKTKMEEKHPAIPLLNEISNAAEAAGDSIDEIIWSVNPQQDEAADTLIRIRNYHSQLLEAAGIRYDFYFDAVPQKLKLDMGLRRDLWLICKEAINNLVKYASCSHAVIRIAYRNNAFHISIEDNGKGFVVEEVMNTSRRNGLKNMQERAGRYRNGSFSIKSEPGKGTVVSCVLPLNHTPKM